MELNTIYYGDCLDFLKTVGNDVFDHTITSPPYNLNLRVLKGKYITLEPDSCPIRSKYENGYTDALTMEEYFNWQLEVIEHLIRTTKKYVFYNIQMVSGNKVALFKLIGRFAENIKEVLIWDKVNSQPAIGELCLNSCYEFIFVFCKSDLALTRKFEHGQFKRGTVDNLWHITTKHKKFNGVNTATFPEKLVTEIIYNFTAEGDLVFDPFIGTGTTATAAIKTGRKYVGCEINTDYAPIIESQIQINNYNNDLF